MRFKLRTQIDDEIRFAFLPTVVHNVTDDTYYVIWLASYQQHHLGYFDNGDENVYRFIIN